MKNIFKLYYSAKGRINRAKYSLYLVNNIVLFAGLLCIVKLFPDAESLIYLIVLFSWLILYAWIQTVFMIKRLHDLNYSGFWVIGVWVLSLVAFIILFIKGTKGTNKYGEDPLINKKQPPINNEK